MSEKQKDKIKPQAKKHRMKYLALIILILSILFVAIIGHFCLIPTKVRWKVEQAVLKLWNGQVDIGDIEVNYFGPIQLRKVSLFDKFGRQFCYAETVEMALTNWPSLHPVVTGIEIDKLNLQIPSEDKKIILPSIYPVEQTPKPVRTIDIHYLAINKLDISTKDEQGTKFLFGNLQLQAVKKGGFYDFVLNRFSTVTEKVLLTKGRIDLKTLETELSLQIKHTVQKPEMALVFTALNIPKLSAEGKLEADLRITGCLRRPKDLNPEGTIKLDGWTVAMDDKTIVKNLTTKANVKDRHFGFENITVTACNSIVTGSLYVETKQNLPTEFSGQVSSQDMSFVELTSILGGPGKKATKGTVTLNYTFSGKDKDLQNLIGEGQIFLDDADITVIPVVPYIFQIVGLSQLEPLKMSDVECTFTTSGSVVTIKTAYISNSFAAINARPGGTINLQTKQINIYVNVAPLKQIDAIIKLIPVVNIIDNLKDNLTRLKVQGNWSDPPSKLIKKEPIKDIKDATVGFFQDVINSGGQITQEMRKRLGTFSKPTKQTNN